MSVHDGNTSYAHLGLQTEDYFGVHLLAPIGRLPFKSSRVRKPESPGFAPTAPHNGAVFVGIWDLSEINGAHSLPVGGY